MATLTETNVWLEKARTLAPVIEQYRDEGERQRYLAKPLYEAMRELGLFRLWLPRSVGGEELDFRSVVEVVEGLAYMDGSAAWNLVIALQSGWLLGFVHPDVAADMMAEEPNATLGGSGQPNGVAVPVEGGYRVTGRWSFASGSNHTRWLCGVSRIKDGDEFRTREDGTPLLHFIFFSRDQYEFIDTWNTVGLRATGSNDFLVDDVFVPEGRTIDVSGKESRFQSGTLYRTRFQQIFGWPLAFVGLGVAAEALDAFKELAANKTPSRGRQRLADYDHVQMTLGRALAKLNSGRAYLYEMVNRLWAAMEQGRGDDDAIAVEIALATTNAAESAAEAVDLVRTAAGSSGIYEGNKIERCWRDVHVATQHQNLSPSNYIRAGAFDLGLGFGSGR
jgi:alkylation response protein AidB-like acyl-CoA dehydrogenase